MSMGQIKENGFTLKKARSRQYPAEMITDADYIDDLALLTNTHIQDEPLLHNLKQAARDTCLYMITNKTEYMF